MTYSGLTLIKDYFGGVRPVTTDELKTLSMQERQELAGAIAKAKGLTETAGPDGRPVYND